MNTDLRNVEKSVWIALSTTDIDLYIASGQPARLLCASVEAFYYYTIQPTYDASRVLSLDHTPSRIYRIRYRLRHRLVNIFTAYIGSLIGTAISECKQVVVALSRSISEEVFIISESYYHICLFLKRRHKKVRISSIYTPRLQKKICLRHGPFPTNTALFYLSMAYVARWSSDNCIDVRIYDSDHPPETDNIQKRLVASLYHIGKTALNIRECSGRNTDVILFDSLFTYNSKYIALAAVSKLNSSVFRVLPRSTTAPRYVIPSLYPNLIRILCGFSNSLWKSGVGVARTQDFMFMSRKIVPEQVRGFGRYILESVFSALFTRVSIALLRPRIIILGHSGFVEENLQALVASTSDVSTLCFVEKGIGFDFSRHGYYGRVDSYAVWDRFGEADIRNTFNNSLRNEVSVVNLQSFGTLNSGDVSAASKSLMEFEEIEERPRKSRVIILTSAINFGFTPLTASIKDHVDAWGDICSLATDYPNVEFVIRTHPSFDDYSFYRLLCRCEAIGNLTLQSPRSNLSQTAYGSDACLMVTSVTTALEEWASLNKPVGLYAKALHSHKAWRELHTDCQVCIMETKEELISFMAYVEHQERNDSTSPRVAEVARTGISIESLSIQLLDLSDGKVAPNEWGSLISYITFARVIRSTVRVLSTYLVFYSLLSCLLIGSAIAPRFTLRLICRLLFGWRLC